MAQILCPGRNVAWPLLHLPSALYCSIKSRSNELGNPNSLVEWSEQGQLSAGLSIVNSGSQPVSFFTVYLEEHTLQDWKPRSLTRSLSNAFAMHRVSHLHDERNKVLVIVVVVIVVMLELMSY
jgi:hypothetical protein